MGLGIQLEGENDKAFEVNLQVKDTESFSSDKYEYTYEPDLILYRILKPVNSEVIENYKLKTVFQIPFDDFREFYESRKYFFISLYDATEKDFALKYASLFEAILNAPEILDLSEIDKPDLGNEYLTDKDISRRNYWIKLKRKLILNSDRDFFYFSNQKKLRFLEDRSENGSDSYNTPNFSRLKPRPINTITGFENNYFRTIHYFSIDYLEPNELSNNNDFKNHLELTQDMFKAEIFENMALFDLHNRNLYYDRLYTRINEDVYTYIKIVSKKTKSEIATVPIRINDQIPEIDSINKDEIHHFISLIKESIESIKETLGNTIQNPPKIEDLSASDKIGSNKSKSTNNKYTELKELISDKKYDYIMELLEDRAITKDGNYILGPRKKSSILGIVEALQDKSILPSIEKQTLCKLIAKEIGLKIASDLEETNTSKKFKTTANNYIKGNPV
jgi:hypothetical protein